jgi:hypothetical protein
VFGARLPHSESEGVRNLACSVSPSVLGCNSCSLTTGPHKLVEQRLPSLVSYFHGISRKRVPRKHCKTCSVCPFPLGSLRGVRRHVDGAKLE